LQSRLIGEVPEEQLLSKTVRQLLHGARASEKQITVGGQLARALPALQKSQDFLLSQEEYLGIQKDFPEGTHPIH